MKIKAKNILLFLILSGIFVYAGFQQNAVGELFETFRKGIAVNNISDFSEYFGSKTYISLSDGTSGYFSSNQAYYVLKKYLNQYEPIECQFERTKVFERSAYATGKLKYQLNGRRGSAGIYISLQSTGDGWIISQITIN